MLIWMMWLSWQVDDVKMFYRLQRKIGGRNQEGKLSFLGFCSNWSVIDLRIISDRRRLAIRSLCRGQARWPFVVLDDKPSFAKASEGNFLSALGIWPAIRSHRRGQERWPSVAKAMDGILRLRFIRRRMVGPPGFEPGTKGL